MMNTKMKIKTGDTVRILRGKDRGKKGKVMAVVPLAERLVVEGLNLVKRHVRARRANEKGQRVEVAAPIRIANVQLVCPQCRQSTRVGISRADGKAVRVCKQCKAHID